MLRCRENHVGQGLRAVVSETLAKSGNNTKPLHNPSIS